MEKVEAQGRAEGTELQPFVTIPIVSKGWIDWCETRNEYGSIFEFANEQFSLRVQELSLHARDLGKSQILPARYLLVTTDVIGQDRANDVSHITVVWERPNLRTLRRDLVKNARIFHEHAVALAAAYAIKEGVEAIMYNNNLEYAWV